MRLRTFVLIPVAMAIVLSSLHLLFTPMDKWGIGLDIIALFAKASAMVGGVLAARAFGRGDFLRYAFSIHAFMYGVFVVRDCFALIPPIRAALDAAHMYESLWRVFFVTANVSGVVAAFMIARAARLALFDADDNRVGRICLLGALLVGLALTGPSIMASAMELPSGQLHHFIVFIGSCADLATFVLAVPVIRLIFALRGGMLYIPWALFAFSRVCWLVRDCFGVAPAWLWGQVFFALAAEIARLLACGYDFSAGLAFRQTFAAPAETDGD
ncbi:MAG TPA: hypothetical protein PK156_03565 [Polyangium sp.]|nr:hypothetical protein [Polyangium sp.]